MRALWGFLTLLSVLWMCYGLTLAGSAFQETTAANSSEAAMAGASIGASIGFGVFLCTGAPFFLLFLFLFLRAGSVARQERMHAEHMAALSRKDDLR